jgi:ATP-dependent Clp protease, protease subunit
MKKGTILIYESIGKGYYNEAGMTDIAFYEAVKACKADGCDELDIHLNSYGGDTKDAAGIIATIRGCGLITNARVDGVIASCAFDIAMACTNVFMGDGAMGMIHQSSSICFGNKNDMMEMAKLLEKTDLSTLYIYEKKYKGTKEEFCKKFYNGKDNWLSRSEIIDLFHVESQSYPLENVPQNKEVAQMKYGAFVSAATQRALKKAPTLLKIHQNSIPMSEEQFKKILDSIESLKPAPAGEKIETPVGNPPLPKSEGADAQKMLKAAKKAAKKEALKAEIMKDLEQQFAQHKNYVPAPNDAPRPPLNSTNILTPAEAMQMKALDEAAKSLGFDITPVKDFKMPKKKIKI